MKVPETFFVCSSCGSPCNNGMFPSTSRTVRYLPHSQFQVVVLDLCEDCATISPCQDATILEALREIHYTLRSSGG